MSTPATQATQVCSRHGDRETLLTCGRCGQSYCTDCLIHTPAGQRCHQCAGVSRHATGQATWTAVWQTVAIAAAASAGTLILSGWLFVLLLAAIAGFAGATRWAPLVNYHTRNRTLAIMALSFSWRHHPRSAHLRAGLDAHAGQPSPPAPPSLLRSATPCYCSSPPSPPASPGGVCGSLGRAARHAGDRSPPCGGSPSPVIPAHAGIHAPSPHGKGAGVRGSREDNL